MRRPPRNIFEAVIFDDIAALQNFVYQKNISLTRTDNWMNQTVAHIAIRHKNLPILKFVLEKEPSLFSKRDAHGYSVFHRAADKGDLPIVKYLVENWKADILQPVNYIWGNTALHVAAEAGNLDVLKYFIEEKNIDPTLRNVIGQPPAFSAASFKNLPIIQYLIEGLNVDVTMTDSKNDNILFISVRMRDQWIPRYLLDDRKLKFDINWRGYLGRTVAYWAARVKRTDFMEYFVEDKKADINIADDMGETPLHHAAKVGNIQVVKYLLRQKAKIDAVNADGKKAIDLATDKHTIEYLTMKMNNRGRRSVVPQLAQFPNRLIDKGLIAEDAFNSRTANRCNSSLICSFLTIAQTIIKSGANKTCYLEVRHPSLLSPQEIIRNRMDPLVFEAINDRSYYN